MQFLLKEMERHDGLTASLSLMNSTQERASEHRRMKDRLFSYLLQRAQTELSSLRSASEEHHDPISWDRFDVVFSGLEEMQSYLQLGLAGKYFVCSLFSLQRAQSSLDDDEPPFHPRDIGAIWERLTDDRAEMEKNHDELQKLCDSAFQRYEESRKELSQHEDARSH